MTNEQVKADIAANLPDNNSGLITPAKLRTELGTMVDYSDSAAAAAVAVHNADAGAHLLAFSGHQGLHHRQNSLPCGGTVHCYGDSITAGVGASDEAHRYANIIAAGLGRTLTNAAVSGDQALDVFYACNSYVPASGDLVTVLIGTNDANIGGAGLIPEYKNILSALLTFLNRGAEILNVSTYEAPAGITESAGWSDVLTFSYLRSSATEGSYIQFTPTSKGVYFGYIMFTGDSVGVSITADGVVVHTATLVGPSETHNGHWYGLQMLRLDGDYSGKVVRVTMADMSGTAHGIYYKFLGSAPVSPAGKPLLICGLVPPFADLSAVPPAYAAAQVEVCDQLISDGYNIHIANTHGRLGPALFTDNLHTNDAGNAALADAFLLAAL